MTESERTAAALERIGLILAALYASHLGDVDEQIRADRLSRCGFSNGEVADLMGKTPNAVNVLLHRARSRKKPPSAAGRGRRRKWNA
jgi:hypothetical protein